MGASAVEAAPVFSGRLRRAVSSIKMTPGHSLGSVACLVVAVKSIGSPTSIVTVIQFVAFGIKNVGLWGGLTI